MILRAGSVVTMDGPPIEGGAVWVRGNKIVKVGRLEQRDFGAEEIIDLRQYVLLPGLINTHCHLDYTCLRGRIPRQSSFTDWIEAINREKAGLTAQDYAQSIKEGSAEAMRFGTTTVVNLEAVPKVIGRSNCAPLRVWWCPELMDVSATGRTAEIVEQAVTAVEACANKNGGVGLAPHALFTASPEMFRRCVSVAVQKGFLLTTHLAESAEEMQMFRNASGRLFDFLHRLGRPMRDCGHSTPVGRFLRLIQAISPPDAVQSTAKASVQTRGNVTPPRWILAHLNEVVEADVKLLKQCRENVSIVHCPRSHAYFGHSSFRFEELQAAGLRVCLGTDSLASNNDLNLFEEMREFWKMRPLLSPYEILAMVTLNSAAAIGAFEKLGRIRAGYLADMTALPVPGSEDVLTGVLDFTGEVPWMMIDGEIMTGG